MVLCAHVVVVVLRLPLQDGQSATAEGILSAAIADLVRLLTGRRFCLWALVPDLCGNVVEAGELPRTSRR